MNNIWKLFKGEIVRLFLYKVVFFAVLVSSIWVLIISLLSASEVKTLLPFVVVMDSGLMSIILLGPMFYYEKQEGIAKSLLVAPISVAEILIAKVGRRFLMALSRLF